MQRQPGVDDGAILHGHGVRQGEQVRLVGRVVAVRLEEGDDAGRGGVHEGARGAHGGHRRLQAADVALHRAGVLHRDGADAARPAVVGRAAGGGLPLEEAGKRLQVARRAALAVALEAGDAVLDVGGVADLAHLAVADQVHAGLHLPRHHVVDRMREDGLRIRLRFALLPAEDEVGDRLGTRQAAHVRGEDAVGAGVHSGASLGRLAAFARG